MRISDIAHFAHSKNLDNMMDKLQKQPDQLWKLFIFMEMCNNPRII